MMHNDILSGKHSSDIENVDWSVGTAHLSNVARFGSSSSQASQSSGDICRICHCESDPFNPLLTPCYCSGSLKYVHHTCLQQWLTASETNSCELCKFPFVMHTKIKPFNEWRSLDMSGVERRRLFCAVLFHCAAALCVIWSLCVLIERAAEEVKRGLIVVVTVGLTGGVVFMYIQCRQYLQLCHRWRARNRILLIQNAPEKMHPISPPSPVIVLRNYLPRSGNSSTTMGTAGSNNNRASHGQIVANIENNSLHYDRDWTLDDSSQSSFKPCPQGSGSMLPFHDSAHNMSDNVRHSGEFDSPVASCSGDHHDIMPNPIKTSDLNLFKVSPRTVGHLPSSAIFLENSDILNDTDYPRLYQRHSTIFTSPERVKDTRRYSDTKLLQQHGNAIVPIFNVTSVLGSNVTNATIQSSKQPSPNITDIIFENSGSTYDPLELNIQEMLELDIRQHQLNVTNAARLSLNNVSNQLNVDNRNFFKSLPNLSLIKMCRSVPMRKTEKATSTKTDSNMSVPILPSDTVDHSVLSRN